MSFGILSIAVSNDFQGFGIGKKLMLDAEEEAAKCGYKIMNLTVHPSNENAVRFYEKLKWEKISRENKAWKGQMVKKLRS